MSKINIDALIPREDFEIEEKKTQNSSRQTSTLRAQDLAKGEFLFSAIRKPEFQRETNEWDESKIITFLESFLDGDLIPAIILWSNPSNYTFVIDGAHRLSTIAAWVNDDYGDGEISRSFFQGVIQEEQIENAESIRQAIRKKIGAYSEYKLAVTNPEKVRQEIQARVSRLGTLAIQIQWVEGDAKKAEDSFFKINQSAAKINDTELKLLKSRHKPNCIAARAIIRAGTGHKYWSAFEEHERTEIERISKEINGIIFSPPLKQPIKSLDIPVGGKIFSATTLQLVSNFVSLCNNINDDNEKELQDDVSGIKTIKLLKKCLEIANKINSSHPSSLGLHPIVYFYSKEGRYKTASFYGVIGLILEFEQNKDLLNKFIKNREKFESILLKYDYLVQQIGRKYRQATKAMSYIKNYFIKILDLLDEGGSEDNVVNSIVKSPDFLYLVLDDDKEEISGKDFSRETKSKAFIKEAIVGASKCKICGGYIHRNSMSIDHIVRKIDGGLGDSENAQITHPYCNTTYKN